MKSVAFLRAVNVGGHNKVNMKELKSALEGYGFGNVTTYIQSGNIVFETVPDAAAAMERIIAERFSVQTKTIVRSAEELAKIIAGNPYPEDKTYVTMLSGCAGAIDKISENSDEFMLCGENIYVCINTEYHKAVYSNQYFEKRTDYSATTRKMKTLKAMLQLCDR